MFGKVLIKEEPREVLGEKDVLRATFLQNTSG